jgi:hypothetical protein
LQQVVAKHFQENTVKMASIQPNPFDFIGLPFLVNKFLSLIAIPSKPTLDFGLIKNECFLVCS